MANFTAKDVQALRQATGAGMMDAKNALVENDGDSEAAAKWLREKGIAKSASRSDRDNSEGVVVARVIDRDRPAVDDFVTNRAAFEEEFAEYMMQHAWPARVAEFGGLYERSVDLEALRAVLSAGAHAPE